MHLWIKLSTMLSTGGDKNNKKNYKKTLDKTANVWYYVITERADKPSKRKEVRL